MAGDERAAVTLRRRDLMDTAGDPAAELQQALLDEDLREIVARETEAVRHLIVAAAFSQTNLLDPVGEDGDMDEDPMGIASW
jgi:His-Xaa-Ser system protein HxsD